MSTVGLEYFFRFGWVLFTIKENAECNVLYFYENQGEKI